MARYKQGAEAGERAKKGQYIFQFGPSDIGKIVKRKPADPDNLEEELARPSKYDYNLVRKALIIARSDVKEKDGVLQERLRDLDEKDRIIKDLEHQLLVKSNKVKQMKVMTREARLATRNDTSERMPSEDADEYIGTSTRSVRVQLLRLKTMIREFVEKYFSGKLRQPSTAQLGAGWAHQYMPATTPAQETYMNYLRSERRCPMIIEAFIWRLLCGVIFDGAPWSGSEDMRRHLCGLQTLFHKSHNAPDSGPRKMRSYAQWKGQTTQLVIEMCEGSAEEADFHRFHLQRHVANAISEVIVPFMRSSLVGHGEALNGIVSQAVSLDKMMSQQRSGYTWAFSPDVIESPFNYGLDQKNVMEVHPGEKTASKLAGVAKARVYLVVAPGLRLRGEDNSLMSFEGERWVMPMEVSCVKPRPQNKFGPTRNGSDATMEG